MPIHVALSHRTEYRYDRPVSLSPHVIRLRPAPHCRTPVLAYSLKVSPEKHFINWQQDPHGNYLARVVFPDTARELSVTVDLVAELAVYNPFDFFLEPDAEHAPFDYDPTLGRELAAFLEVPAPGPRLAAFLATVDRARARTVDFLVGLNRRLAQEIRYIVRLEPGVQTPDETLALQSGSCRDTGWLLVQVLRHLGFAARFVSGYLIQLTPDVKPLEGPAGAAADFTDLHAWVEVYLPGAGWIGLDPTSGLLAGEGHLPVAATPDPQSAAPVTGRVDKCEVEFRHEMHVQRIYESPRVTRPYTDTQWADIVALGHQVDADLEARDVRLTMGGEPTFISIDDMDGAEWNVAALGTRKRELAGTLIKRLRHQFGAGGLLHYGQGKWYPGESLPRWALGCWWRRDGEPIWHDDGLIADESRDYGHGASEAQRFIEQLASVLGVDPSFVMPAYEDAWYYMWRERRLPTNVDPLQSNLRDEEERARLARIFERGLNQVVGYVMPIQARAVRGRSRWVSGPWFLRPETLFLVPGDSPIGFRLPLDSLPWVAESEFPYLYQRDPMAAPLPVLAAPRRAGMAAGVAAGGVAGLGAGAAAGARIGTPIQLQALPGPASDAEPGARLPMRQPGRGQSAPWLIRTALCVEPRDGRLHVFIPPMTNTEDYLDLVSAIEETAGLLDLPVILEGEAPPPDSRLQHIKVTPDPGVIEVNLHPARNWDELVTQVTTLYEEARQTRLGTDKFMLDGRHTGTGGGNHVVIGGPSPADSPILRRPDLLRSLLAYWNNHPSLSYLFSGLFIGPTSQHPRVDEARHDSLHELEIAFQRTPDADAAHPWLVDRLYRNLLVDVTGNTHRTEFCIDKLFAPEASEGRRGLVELRSFEMPPHARMSLTQQLLLRALIAAFWKEPYRQGVVRWGSELHDRFMLPHFVRQDFTDVLDDLGVRGYGLRADWFAPHFEFRFPFYGAIARAGVRVELRQALEPWHVLGEEPGAGGTVRYVDSSVERLQVKVTGLTEGRHYVTCNGRRIPLHPTGTAAESVGGVRYRAWQPPSALHPTIAVHAPLTFDVVDGWNRRSLGGCVYHVAHPGGRNYETFPVNAYEAESRRLARFFDIGHTSGPIALPPEERHADFPFTLDLRRAPRVTLEPA